LGEGWSLLDRTRKKIEKDGVEKNEETYTLYIEKELNRVYNIYDAAFDRELKKGTREVEIIEDHHYFNTILDMVNQRLIDVALGVLEANYLYKYGKGDQYWSLALR
jgi:hypothetical protein